MGTTFCAKGMARRMGTETKPSWDVSHIHVAYIDVHLEEAYQAATDATDRHEISCAGCVKLMAYLGWLRAGELFSADRTDVTLTHTRASTRHRSSGIESGRRHQIGSLADR